MHNKSASIHQNLLMDGLFMRILPINYKYFPPIELTNFLVVLNHKKKMFFNNICNFVLIVKNYCFILKERQIIE